MEHSGILRSIPLLLNSSPWTNGRHFADDIFRCISLRHRVSSNHGIHHKDSFQVASPPRCRQMIENTHSYISSNNSADAVSSVVSVNICDSFYNRPFELIIENFGVFFTLKTMIRSNHNLAYFQIWNLIRSLELYAKQNGFSLDFDYELINPLWNHYHDVTMRAMAS